MILLIRYEKNREKKKVKLFKFLYMIFAFLIMLFSVGIWINKYIEFQPFELIEYLQTFYISTIGFFIMISAPGSKLLNQLFKSSLKLFFSVWIMAFILISSIGQLEQTIYIIYTTFIIGYLEVLFEVNDIIKENILNLKLEKIRLKYTENEDLSMMSISLTISIVSLIHIILAFIVENSLNKLLV